MAVNSIPATGIEQRSFHVASHLAAHLRCGLGWSLLVSSHPYLQFSLSQPMHWEQDIGKNNSVWPTCVPQGTRGTSLPAITTPDPGPSSF